MKVAETERDQFLFGLRELLEFVETHPGFPLPVLPRFSVSVGSKEDLADAARTLGKVQKEVSSAWYSIQRQFGSITLDIFAARDRVCERVVVGTKVIPARPEVLLPAVPERTEEIVEWKCGSLLAEEEQEVRP